jgi:hypothetical protein
VPAGVVTLSLAGMMCEDRRASECFLDLAVSIEELGDVFTLVLTATDDRSIKRVEGHQSARTAPVRRLELHGADEVLHFLRIEQPRHRADVNEGRCVVKFELGC